MHFHNSQWEGLRSNIHGLDDFLTAKVLIKCLLTQNTQGMNIKDQNVRCRGCQSKNQQDIARWICLEHE